MKHNLSRLVFAFLALGATLAVAAEDRPLVCQSQDAKYTLTVNLEQPLSAQVSVDGKLAQFGQLKCNQDGSTISCLSEGVADAGYWAVINEEGGRHVADLSEESFAGARHLAKLSCDF